MTKKQWPRCFKPKHPKPFKKYVSLADADTPKRFRKYLRQMRKPAPEKDRPEMVIIPDWKLFTKKQRATKKLREWAKWGGPDAKPDKRKLRGKRKKEAAEQLRLWKLKNPKGEKMFSKPGPGYRCVLRPADFVVMIGLTPRYAPVYMNIIKKKLGKKKDDLLTIQEFCKYKNVDIEAFIPYLKR